MIFSLVVDMFSETAGQIFLVTTLSYTVGYLIYLGYISRFIGGFGNLFFFTPTSIADLLSLFPTALFTIIRVVKDGFKNLIKKVLYFFIIPVATGWFSIWLVAMLGNYFIQYKFMNYLTNGWLLILQGNVVLEKIYWCGCAGLFLAELGLVYFMVTSPKSSSWSRRLRVSTIIFLEVLGTSLFVATVWSISNWGSVSEVRVSLLGLESRLSNPVAEKLTFDIFFILVVLITSLILVIFGMKMAEEAVRMKSLSKVIALNLKQCVPELEEVCEMEAGDENVKFLDAGHVNSGGHWFIKSSFLKTLNQPSYVYRSTDTIYLVGYFRDNIVLYAIGADVSIKSGRTLLISNTILSSLELQPR